jgi:prepilin-type processing-associated H-X9-DG protein
MGRGRAELACVSLLGLFALGLLAPTLVRAKANANQESCRNNFRLIGTAVTSYADHQGGSLPLVIGPPETPGILAQILPYTEQHSLSKEILATGKPWHDPTNAKVVSTHLAWTQCPETPKPARFIVGQSGGNDYKAAPTDYTAIPLITLSLSDLFPKGHDLTTPLGLKGRATYADVTDGLSTTFLGILEIADKPNDWRGGKFKPRGDEFNRGDGTWVANGINAPRGTSYDGVSAPGPCAMNCSNRAAIYSFHPTGCNFLFADGSVHFINKSLDIWVFYALLTRRGGEILSPDDFDPS